ncbi:MAG: flagellar hook-associated protein FlgL [Armatimonadota bacterium]
MRITYGMLTGNVMSSLMNSAGRLIEAQNTASSGKRISRPSDDVPGIGRSLSLRSALSQLEQLSRNADVVRSQLSVTSTTLDSVVNALQEARRLALTASNSTQTSQSRAAIAAQLDSVMTELARLGNTQYAGKYIFSGASSDTQTIVPGDPPSPPFVCNGDSVELTVQVAPSVYMAANVTGKKLFNFDGEAMPGESDTFSVIDELKTRVLNGSPVDVSTWLARVDAHLANVIAIRSQVGGRLARLEAASNSLADSRTELQRLLSETEDVDLSQALVELRARENIYQAAVAVASRLLNVSLVEYLK